MQKFSLTTSSCHSSNPSKTMWSIIKSTHTKQKEKHNWDANEFNEFFSKIGLQLTDSLPSTSSQKLPTTPALPVFSFKPVTKHEALKVILSLNNSSSRDYLDMDAKFMKAVVQKTLDHFTHLINITLQSKIFPDVLKVSLVHPIFKKGNRQCPNNYRPISILPVFSKIIEKIMRTQIDNHFESFALWSESQFGFRSRKSTEQAILKLLETVNDCFASRMYCVGDFIDLTKAFDCVPHNLLINKLRLYNFCPSALDLVNSYLTGRTQRVINKDIFSNKCDVLTGVPQGSILGPTLFLTFVNDLPGEFNDASSLCLYADDTTILVCGFNEYETVRRAEDVREGVFSWFCQNKLPVNKSKCQTMILSKRPTVTNTLPSVRFLGVELDVGLHFKAHCEMVAQKVSKSLYLLRRLRECVSLKILITSYFGLIHSKIRYAILVWGHAAGVKIIAKEQRRAIRIMAGIPPAQDCRMAFKNFKILTVTSLYILECVVLAHKSNTFMKSTEVHNYNTRQKDNLRASYCRLKSTQNSVNYWAPRLYNKLPFHVRGYKPKKFKTAVQCFLIKECFYDLQEYMDCDIDL